MLITAVGVCYQGFLTIYSSMKGTKAADIFFRPVVRVCAELVFCYCLPVTHSPENSSLIQKNTTGDRWCSFV